MAEVGGASSKGIAQVQLLDGTIRTAEVHWYEAHGYGRKEFKLKLPFLDNLMEPQAHDIHFVVCLNNDGYPASLEVGKLYRVLPDEEAARHGYLCVIDEGGEAYAFAADRFHPVDLPAAVEEILLAAA